MQENTAARVIGGNTRSTAWWAIGTPRYREVNPLCCCSVTTEMVLWRRWYWCTKPARPPVQLLCPSSPHASQNVRMLKTAHLLFIRKTMFCIVIHLQRTAYFYPKHTDLLRWLLLRGLGQGLLWQQLCWKKEFHPHQEQCRQQETVGKDTQHFNHLGFSLV